MSSIMYGNAPLEGLYPESQKTQGFSKMAKITIRIDPHSGATYFPKVIRDEGFVGAVESLPGARTFTLIRPGTRLKDVKRSLEFIIKDIELRLKYEDEASEATSRGAK